MLLYITSIAGWGGGWWLAGLWWSFCTGLSMSTLLGPPASATTDDMNCAWEKRAVQAVQRERSPGCSWAGRGTVGRGGGHGRVSGANCRQESSAQPQPDGMARQNSSVSLSLCCCHIRRRRRSWRSWRACCCACCCACCPCGWSRSCWWSCH